MIAVQRFMRLLLFNSAFTHQTSAAVVEMNNNVSLFSLIAQQFNSSKVALDVMKSMKISVYCSVP